MNLQKVMLLKKQMEELEGNVTWWLKEELSCCGITVAQCQVLEALSDKKEVCIAKLAEHLRVDSSTLSRTTNRMVEAGLIDRITNSYDRRYVSLTLTAKGETLRGSLESKAMAYYAQVFKNIPEDKKEQVIESILLLSEAIKKCKE